MLKFKQLNPPINIFDKIFLALFPIFKKYVVYNDISDPRTSARMIELMHELKEKQKPLDK